MNAALVPARGPELTRAPARVVTRRAPCYPRDVATDDEHVDDWVVLRTFDEPMLARMTLDFLRDHAIPVQVRGDSPDGVRNLYSPFDMRIAVPRARLDEAREALDALTAEAATETPFRGPLPPEELRDDEAAKLPQRKKQPAFAAVLAFLVPLGAGHFYAEHNQTGLVVVAGLVLSVGLLVSGAAPAGAVFLALVVLDGVFGFFAVRRFNEGRVPPVGRQRLRGLGLVLGGVVLGGAGWYLTVEAPRRAALAERDALRARLQSNCDSYGGQACHDLALDLFRDTGLRTPQIDDLEARACRSGLDDACKMHDMTPLFRLP